MASRLLRVRPLPTPAPVPHGPRTEHDVTLWTYSKPIRGRWVAGLLVSLAAAVIAISIPQVLGWIVDAMLTDSPTTGTVWAGGGLVFALGIVQAALFFLRRQLVLEPASTVENTMRIDLFDRLLRFPVSFHDRWPSGQLLTRAMGDLSTIRRWTAFGLIQVITVAVQVTLGTLYMFNGAWQLGLLFLAALPITFFCIWRFVTRFRALTRAAQEKTGDMATTVEESVQGLRVLKALGRGPHALRGFTSEAAELRDLEIERGRAMGAVRMQTALMSGATLCAALIWGLNLVSLGQLTVGALTSFFATATLLFTQVERSGMLLSMYLAASVSLDRHRQVMVGPAGEDVSLTRAPAVRRDDAAPLTFRQVHFSYSLEEKPVLVDFTLDVHPGEIIALVGSTGSGKSTVLQLVQRLYEPTEGTIALGGRDIQDFSLPELRGQVAIAFEDPLLFSDSVRENVLLGVNRSRYTAEELDALVARALNVAAANYVYDLPEGLDTVIGEEGMSLSGGQRQRLSLARAIAAQPAVLLLDDPLSALDVDTEEQVLAQLKSELTATTTLLTAHRPSTVALADRVALIADGGVVAVGRHSDLLTHPAYRDLMSAATSLPGRQEK
ncbi:ABC transporter ATP-binding protein [Rothia nasisuis]|uniref:ABC transporter ATP-binding protein n=1 Tax=Rothia nasisuis TaxID=2109647 RepID=UPI001F40E875|nr:ABC transporter ATP-binding protein [Rothia nasisuis]